MLRVGMGAGAAELAPTDLVLTLGPHHPSAHGVLHLRLCLDGERIVGAEPEVGYMHRGAEKLFEVRDYRQAIVLANRHDWLSAFSSELGLVLAVERLMGLEVPARAVWLRTLLAELNRLLSALMFLAGLPPETGAGAPAATAFRVRETLQTVMEEATGGRIHFMFNRVGGVAQDVPAGWVARTRRAVAGVRSQLPDLTGPVLGSELFGERTRGVGVLSAAAAASFGVSGPVARASGLDLDLRRDDPYLAYGELGFGSRFPAVTRSEGDSYARYRCLLDQMPVSLDLADACLDGLPGGAVNVRLPKTVKAPEGHVYCWTENPLGINGYYLVSRGGKTPERLKLRTASFANVSALPALLEGVRLADLVTVLGSVFFVVGDLDK
jgi:NADH-quinone oxidoreductase subunit D